MENKRLEKDLKQIEEIAQNQGNKINLSTILIVLKCDIDEISEIINYLEERNIEVISEDVEPDGTNDNDINNRVIPFDPTKIDIKMDKITIDSIIKRIKNDELEFDSSFQRKHGLWRIEQKSQLIESIILKIPLPAFYFDASDDDRWQIIDGLQRITTIKEYVVDKSFTLVGMEFLSDLNKLSYDELPRSLQRRIEETNLNAYLVNPSTPKNVKFNIFKRINTGGLVLESQEIRNALYQGQAADFLLKMSQMKEFIVATDHSVKSDRMLDREFCLRYITFTHLFNNEYNGLLDEFLNLGMEYISKLSHEQLEVIQNEFARTMNACKEIFGRYAFRKINDEGKRGPVNKALFEAWSMIINDISDEQIKMLIEKKDVLINKYIDLLGNYTFLNYIRSADKTSIKARVNALEKIVYGVLNDD